MRVLVVDDVAARRLLRRSLERAGLEVVEAAGGAAALRAQRMARPAVAVLGVKLPDSSGLELMAELRRDDPELPIILLTDEASEEERVQGLVSGADDFVVQPCSGAELAARVLAVARRRHGAPHGSSAPSGLQVDAGARSVSVGGEPVELTRREFDLLHHLTQHPGRAFSRAELLQAVWASSADWQSEATVTEHVRRLRTKLEPDPSRPTTIVTVRGTGYRFDPGRPAAPERHPEPAGADLTEDPVAVVQGGVVVHVNGAAARLVGAADASEVEGRPFLDFVAPCSIGASMARHEGARHGRWPRPEVLTVRRLDGREVHTEVASSPVLWHGRQASQVTLWDLSEDTSKLRELATGLRSDVAEAVIVCDAQLRVQSFNPAAEVLYGWREADVVGRHLRDVTPWVTDDRTERRAWDEFERDGRWHGEVVQRRRDGSTVTVRCSATLLRDRAGAPVGVTCVNRPVVGAPAAQPPLDAPDPYLVAELRRGLERHELVVHYQPVVELDTGRWLGVEALVRWAHPERGLLPPSAFIEAAERSGAITDLGHLVFEEAARQWRRWREAGADLHVAVNLSGRQLLDPDLPTRVEAVLEAFDVPVGCLRFEVTETALVEDLAEATTALRRLVELGARIAIDDFGTGWASLTYLRQFPVHALKIDRSFVAGLGANVPDSAIVSSIVSLGSELGLDVIAEGIETTGQLERLLALGCEQGQGYLLAEPAPADVLVVPGAVRWDRPPAGRLSSSGPARRDGDGPAPPGVGPARG